MRAPVIGVTGRRASARDDFPETLRHLHSDVFVTAYAECVARAGGIPVHLSRAARVDDLVTALDGLLVAGGQDVDPRRYGSVPGPRSTVLDPERDAFECALVLAAVDQRRPVLGICRGAQVVNVAHGGTLHTDLATGTGESHAFYGYPAAHRSHPVVLTPGSTLGRLLGPTVGVNSYHHQAVDVVGHGLVATAHAPDGVVEGIERPGADVVGVQWHPEMFDEPDPVFRWLVERSAAAGTFRPHVSEETRAIA